MSKDSNLIGSSIQGYLIQKKLGSGGYGSVYLATKEELGKKYHTAIKHIVLPEEEQYEEVLQQFDNDKALTKEHFTKIIHDITSEINTMLALNKKDNRHIVAYYDHEIQEQENPLRFDVFMRMEYLVPLSKYMRQNGMTLDDILQLGIDMCEALTLCHNNDVMHRDIKEANIFINESGNFKLGDFGVAKSLQEVTKAASMKGTSSYMAPEIHQRKPYDTTVDIYSLGIVLYKLLNYLRLPFMPDFPASILADDIYVAETKRLSEEIPPLPMKAQNRLGEIVIKACATKEKRYQTAAQLQADLISFRNEITEAEREYTIIQPAGQEEKKSEADEPTQGLFAQENQVAKEGDTLSIDHSKVDVSKLEVNNEEYNPYYEAKEESVKAEEKKATAEAEKAQKMGQEEASKEDSTSKKASEKETTNAEKNTKEAQKANKKSAKERGFLKTTKGKIITGGVVSAVLLAGGIGAYMMVSNSVSSFKNLYESASYAQAQTIYDSLVAEDKTSQIASIRKYLREEIAVLESDYVAGLSEYDPTLVRLEAISEMDILEQDEVEKVLKHVNDLRTSRKAFTDANQYIASAEYELAIVELRKVITEDENYTKAQELLASTSTSYKTALMVKVKTTNIAEGATAALKQLNEALEVLPNDADIKAEISKYEGQLTTQQKQEVASQIAKAAEAAEKAQYETAVAILEEAKNIGVDIETIEAKIAEYEKYLPVSIFDMTTYFNEGDIGYVDWVPGEDFDNLNHSGYEEGWKFTATENGTWSNKCYLQERRIGYILDGKYTNFTGTITTTFESKNCIDNRYGVQMKVYGDGKLLWDTTVRGGVRPTKFDINVTGIAEVEIVLESSVYYYGDADTFSFALLDAGFAKRA